MQVGPPRGRESTLAGEIGVCCALALLTALLTVTLRDAVNDDAFITYRYAQNLAAGRGFVFNPGERVLGTTAPLHGLLLGALGLVSTDIRAAALLVSALSCITLGYCIYRFLSSAGARWGGMIAAAILVSSPDTYVHFPLETILLASLHSLALLCFQARRWAWMAVVLGLATLVRGDSALWALVLGGFALRGAGERRGVLRAAPWLVLPVLVWALYARWYYGAAFSNSASTKSGWDGHALVFASSLWERGLGTLLAEPWLSGAALPFILGGVVVTFRSAEYQRLRVLPCYWLVYVAAYTALRIFWPHTWYYYPLHVVHAALFGLGFEHGVRALDRVVKRAAARSAPLVSAAAGALVAALVALNAGGVYAEAVSIPTTYFAGGRDALYRATAEWLVATPGRCARTASLEVGTLAYYSNRTFVDRMGLVTPAAGAEMKRTKARDVSVAWTVREFHPDCFAFAGSERPWPARLHEQPEYALERVFRHPPSRSELAVYSR